MGWHLSNGARFDMARYDVFHNSGRSKLSTPYLLDIQSNHLAALGTRVVIPLRRRDRFPTMTLPGDLLPLIVIDGIDCLLDVPQLGAIPASELKECVTSLAGYRLAITTAIDRMSGGY
jgi:toxin CcdB